MYACKNTQPHTLIHILHLYSIYKYINTIFFLIFRDIQVCRETFEIEHLFSQKLNICMFARIHVCIIE